MLIDNKYLFINKIQELFNNNNYKFIVEYNNEYNNKYNNEYKLIFYNKINICNEYIINLSNNDIKITIPMKNNNKSFTTIFKSIDIDKSLIDKSYNYLKNHFIEYNNLSITT